MSKYSEEMADTEYGPNEDSRPCCDCGNDGRWQQSADGTGAIFSCDECHQEAINNNKDYADKFRIIPTKYDQEKYYYKAAMLHD